MSRFRLLLIRWANTLNVSLETSGDVADVQKTNRVVTPLVACWSLPMWRGITVFGVCAMRLSSCSSKSMSIPGPSGTGELPSGHVENRLRVDFRKPKLLSYDALG